MHNRTINTGAYMKMKSNLLIQAAQSRFVTLPGEELIFAQRKHWLTFATPIFMLSIMGIAASIALIIASSMFINYLFLLFPAFLLMSVFILSVALRSIIDWYFNIYIVTNKKIMEISYSPLSSQQINEVLLDQVKCTEIDTKTEGFLNDILDIGHVIVTFDRPTHQEEFVFDYMESPRKIEAYLEGALYGSTFQNIDNQNILYKKNKNSPGKWTYLEDINPFGGVAI